MKCQAQELVDQHLHARIYDMAVGLVSLNCYRYTSRLKKRLESRRFNAFRKKCIMCLSLGPWRRVEGGEGESSWTSKWELVISTELQQLN